MFLTTNELVVTVTVAIVAGLAAAIAAAAAGRRLTKDNRALRKAVTEVGLGRVPDDDGPKLTSQLDQVRRELSATARRLAASREREQALEASRRELVAWVSHDLRTPLAGLRAMTEALEDGVVIMGLTRGRDTRSHHSERLDAGEVMVAQFTELTAAIKIRGRAEILTDVGRVESGS